MAEAKKVATKKPVAKAAEEKPAAKKPAAKKPAAKKAPVKKVAEVKEETVATAAPVEKVAVKKAAKAKVGNKKAAVINRVKEQYETEIKKALMEKFHYTSIMQVPALEKIVINIGVGDATTDSKRLEEAVSELGLITGQHPVTTKSKKSIASFKLREGQEIGCKVTLRGSKMYEFYDKLVSIALPRVRDFRGVSANSFDGRGNYTLGIKEQLIFPEIDYDKVGKIRGMDIVIVTTASTDKEAFELLTLMGMPFHR